MLRSRLATPHGSVAVVESSGSGTVAAGIVGAQDYSGMALAGTVADSGRVVVAGIACDFVAAVGMAYHLDSAVLGRSSRRAAAVVVVVLDSRRTAGILVELFRALPSDSLGQGQVAGCHSCPKNWGCTRGSFDPVEDAGDWLKQ